MGNDNSLHQSFNMSTIKQGDTVPEGSFAYIAVKEDDPLDMCQLPGRLSTDEWKGKRVVLVGVPGAFTPGCQEKHIPPSSRKLANPLTSLRTFRSMSSRPTTCL